MVYGKREVKRGEHKEAQGGIVGSILTTSPTDPVITKTVSVHCECASFMGRERRGGEGRIILEIRIRDYIERKLQ